jgi:hypothetical protein
MAKPSSERPMELNRRNLLDAKPTFIGIRFRSATRVSKYVTLRMVPAYYLMAKLIPIPKQPNRLERQRFHFQSSINLPKKRYRPTTSTALYSK